MNLNLLKKTDSYKVSQAVQYPPGTTQIYTYLSARGLADDWPFGDDLPEMTFFGLQYQIKKYFEGQVVTEGKVTEAKKFWDAHFGAPVFQADKWMYIVEKHNGYLPIHIKALPEGTVVPVGTVLMTIENTDPECFWLTNYLETLLVQLWYPSVIASRSREMKKMLYAALKKSGDPSLIDFKLHDFGYRGCTCDEQAAIGGAAHLINFMGTDTAPGLDMLMDYYNTEMPGFSIPATEHSTITSWGRSRESDAILNHLNQYPSGLIACVMDSYNVYDATRDIVGGKLKDKIMERDGTFVVRPDSGYPPYVVIDLLEILRDTFGCKLNEKGYEVLDPHVRIIQGDGIDPAMLEKVLTRMIDHGWSADNIAFGSGGGLLQKDANRDTFKFAAKCSSVTIDGMDFEVYKDPVTDTGKRSLRGKRAVVRDAAGLPVNVHEDDMEGRENLLKTVFMNGKLLKETNLSEMRNLSTVW